MAVTLGALFNQVSNVMSHLGSLNAGYALDVASKMDVDFAGETTELAKGKFLLKPVPPCSHRLTRRARECWH